MTPWFSTILTLGISIVEPLADFTLIVCMGNVTIDRGGEIVSLARWDPFNEMRRMRDDMERIFGSITSPALLSPWVSEGASPAIDVYVQDNNVVIKAEVPGLKKEDVEVTATEDSVTLRGEFKREEETKEEGFYRHERRFGKFFRTIPMPAAIKRDEVKASFKNGVLEVTAPKAAEAETREKKIPIES